MEPNGKTFLVSGAASGLGAATASMLVAAGARVALLDLNADAGAGLARELGDATIFLRTDVTDEAGTAAAVDEAARRLGGIAGVVNCAGIVHGEKVLAKGGPHNLAAFTRTIQVNLIGSFNLARLAAARMAEAPSGPDGERGVIVFTASIAAFDGQIGQAAYSASKAGLVGLTLPLARELARYGIRVMTVAPGIFETPMMSSLPPDVQESLGRMVPFPQRLGRPEEYASLVREIITNRMLNGEVIRLDGAIRMAAK